MSKNAKSTLYPELNKLRKTLLELQGSFAENKPNLDEALRQLAPTKRTGVLNDLKKRANAPVSKKIPVALSEQLNAVRNAIGNFDTLVEQAEQRQALFRGELDDTIASLFVPPLLDTAKRVLGIVEDLKRITYGATAIDLKHELEMQAELLAVGLNALFETLDLRHGILVEDSSLSNGLKELGGFIGKLADRSEAAAMWTVVQDWMRRWENRATYRDALAGWLSFARIEFMPVRNLDLYRSGDVVAQIHFSSGSPLKAEVHSGRLPVGLELTQPDGSLRVTDPKRLIAGTYSGIRLKVENSQGFVNVLSLNGLSFHHDEETVYQFSPNIYIDRLSEGDVLAWPSDDNGEIVTAQVIEGRFPPGVSFDTHTGSFVVGDSKRLRPGNYPLKVVTVDEAGGETERTFTLMLLPSSEGAEGTFVANDPIALPQTTGARLGYLAVKNGYVTSVELANNSILPPGTNLSEMGELLVSNARSLVPGYYAFMVLVGTSLQESFLVPCTLNLISRINLNRE